MLEVLIALSLLGLLMVLIASALTLGSRTLELNERYSDRLNEVRTAQRLLRSALQQSLPVTFFQDARKVQWVFEGGPETMRFVAPLPSQLPGGIQLHTFSLVNSDNISQDLEVSFNRIADEGLRPWGTPQRLLQHLTHLRFSYRGLDNNLRATGWLERWPWPERLPQFVKVELSAQGPIDWPPLVVALHLSPAENPAGVMP